MYYVVVVLLYSTTESIVSNFMANEKLRKKYEYIRAKVCIWDS